MLAVNPLAFPTFLNYFFVFKIMKQSYLCTQLKICTPYYRDRSLTFFALFLAAVVFYRFPPSCFLPSFLVFFSSPCSSVFGIRRQDEREGERKKGPLARLSKGRSWWREGTASAVFAPDKSTSRSAFKNVIICVCIYVRAPAGLACACVSDV